MFTKQLSRRSLGLGAAAIAITACAKTGTNAEAQDVMETKMTDAYGVQCIAQRSD